MLYGPTRFGCWGQTEILPDFDRYHYDTKYDRILY